VKRNLSYNTIRTSKKEVRIMSDGKKSDAVVMIPTYNEKENIANIIEAVLGLEQQFDILVIDDNSPDGTAEIVKGKQHRA
jgi:cellulose synthase/poly-beta-1,6-N-acetylglucosamine synthase-like glycosyltransferase